MKFKFLKSMVFFAFCLLVLVFPVNSFASSILSTTGSIFKGGLEKISSSTYRIQFNRDGLYKAVITAYDDSGFSKEAFQKVFTAPAGYRFVGITDIRCNKYYKLDYYDKSGNLQGSMKLNIDDLEKPTCQSDGGDKDVYEPGEIGEVGSGGFGNCGSAVCECIAQLKDVAQTINSSVTANGSTLNSILNSTNANGFKIDNVNSSVNQVNNSVKENGNTLNKILDSTNANGVRLDKILEQIIPTSDIDIPNDIKVPSLESDKPPMPDKPFKDDSTYFKDQGSASSPPPLPPAGEPVKCWKDDKDSDVCEEANTNKRDDVNKKDEVNKRDEVNKKDEVNKRDEVNKKDDVNKRDEVNKKDDVNKRDDVNKKDDVSERDKPNKVDPVSDRIPVGKRDPTTPIDPIDKGLPNWNSP